MKPSACLACVYLLFAVSAAGAEGPPPAPGYFVRGHAEGLLMPPRNEMDLNLRRPDLQLETDGFGDNFARYALRCQVFVGRRFESGLVRGVFVVLKPVLVLGRTIPQREYTWSPRYIGYARNFGAGVDLPGGWSLYLERHRWSFRDKIAITGDGPYGFHNSITLRKDFELRF